MLFYFSIALVIAGVMNLLYFIIIKDAKTANRPQPYKQRAKAA